MKASALNSSIRHMPRSPVRWSAISNEERPGHRKWQSDPGSLLTARDWPSAPPLNLRKRIEIVPERECSAPAMISPPRGTNRHNLSLCRGPHPSPVARRGPVLPPQPPRDGAALRSQHGCQKEDGPGLANRSRRQTLSVPGESLGTRPSNLKNQARDSCPEVQCPVS